MLVNPETQGRKQSRNNRTVMPGLPHDYLNTLNSVGIENQTLEQQLALFPQFKSSEVIKEPNIPNDNGGLISELLSESNFEETNVN